MSKVKFHNDEETHCSYVIVINISRLNYIIVFYLQIRKENPHNNNENVEKQKTLRRQPEIQDSSLLSLIK